MRRRSTKDVPKITLRNVWRYRDEFMARVRKHNPCQSQYRRALRCIEFKDKSDFKNTVYNNISWLVYTGDMLDINPNIYTATPFIRGYSKVLLHKPKETYYVWLMNKKGDLVKPYKTKNPWG